MNSFGPLTPRRHALWALIAGLSLGAALGGCALRAKAAEAAKGAKRNKVGCADYARTVQPPASFIPHSWGQSLPPALQKLPPGAALCGVDTRAPKDGSAVILSPLFGSDLESFYAPLFSEVGCKPLDCQVETRTLGKTDVQQTICKCHGHHMIGNVATDSGNEMYSVSLIRY